MPGTIIFKPIQANLTHKTSHLVEMDPYCLVTLGSKQFKSEPCLGGGQTPHWNDCITLQTIEEPKCLIEIKDKNTLVQDSEIASCEVDLKEIEKQGQVLRWYALQFDNKPAGEILLEATFKPSATGDVLHNNLDIQMGLGLAGLANPHLGELTHKPHSPEIRQNKIGDFILPRHHSLPAHIDQAEIRSNDLDVPTNRDQLTSPGKDLAWYIQHKKEEHVTNFSTIEPEHHLGRAFSHQPLKHTTPPIHEGHKDKDWFHCDHKEMEGLDLTSELGPHKSGYDKNLWKLPENLKDIEK